MTTGNQQPTACLALADGTVVRGIGFGAEGVAVGELCFNTAMTGYQEVLTDPSYAGQIVLFTFPHIGNVGVTPEDSEAGAPAALGLVVREVPTQPSNWRSQETLDAWLRRTGRIGIAGVDTRYLTRRIRSEGMPQVALAHDASGQFDADALVEQARAWSGIVGADLAKAVTREQAGAVGGEGRWSWPAGFDPAESRQRKVVAIDYGAKQNILRCLAAAGCEGIVLPATATAAEVLAEKPDGVFLSNGPGDPAATGEYAVPMIREVLDAGIPVFGICLGHQMLGLALGAKTVKMPFGHHGANHPVQDVATGQVSIVSMNHGFAVDRETLPPGVVETHVSLFDRSNCGLRTESGKAFSVQFHPEASPGPQDSFGLFDQFAELIDESRARG